MPFWSIRVSVFLILDGLNFLISGESFDIIFNGVFSVKNSFFLKFNAYIAGINPTIPTLSIKFYYQSFEISSMEVFSCEYFNGK